MLTARAHNFLYPDPSLEDTISCLQAYEKACADVLFARGLPDLAAVSAVCAAVSKPFNSMMAGIKEKSFSVAELTAAGVRRISVATSLYRVAMTGFLNAARELKDTRQFGFLDRMRPNAGAEQTNGNMSPHRPGYGESLIARAPKLVTQREDVLMTEFPLHCEGRQRGLSFDESSSFSSSIAAGPKAC